MSAPMMDRNDFIRRAEGIADSLLDLDKGLASSVLYQAIAFTDLRAEQESEVRCVLSSLDEAPLLSPQGRLSE